MALLVRPWLIASTTCARCTKLCGTSRLRTMAWRTSFCSGDRFIGVVGRAISDRISKKPILSNLFQAESRHFSRYLKWVRPISGAKNWRPLCLRRPALVLRQLRLALLSAKRCAKASTMTLRRFGSLMFCLHPRSRATSDKTSGPTATRGSSHTARQLRFRAFLCSF